MSSNSPSEDTPLTPEKRVIPISASETWMRQFANRCRKDLDLPPLTVMSAEDLRSAGSFFTREYLAQADAQWDFPAGEEGIANMQALVFQALHFLNNDNAPNPAIANQFMRDAMHAYRKYLASPASEKRESMNSSIESVAHAFADRTNHPSDVTYRTKYFNAISSFGAAVAPNIAFAVGGKPDYFHQFIAIQMMNLDVAAKKQCGQGLDPVTKNRIHTALLVGLENLRQNQPAGAATNQFPAITDFTQKIRGRMDFPGQFPSEERQS